MPEHELGDDKEPSNKRELSMMAPALGIFLPTVSDRGAAPGDVAGDVAAAARHAEELGFESVWVVDQLVAGTGVPLLDSGIALAAAAAATSRVGLAYGVLVVPLHPLAWLAKQVASLQHVSGGRLIIGVGTGGDRHGESWAVAGVPRRERGRRTDFALRALPGLLAGRPVRLAQDPDSPLATLSPSAPVPPVIVGGMSEPALRRAAQYGDGWFPLPAPLPVVARARARLAELAGQFGRPVPPMTTSLMTAIAGGPDLPGQEEMTRRLTDPDGMFGIPADQVPAVLHSGPPDQIAALLAEHFSRGAERVVISVAAGDWFRQAELAAEARNLLGQPV
jgi:alkanesulfonate monooxygenase SsuD/methylene tetrahydromethanopterin reductase-like flavin-dependent oxidoreductase (luciferase family)